MEKQSERDLPYELLSAGIAPLKLIILTFQFYTEITEEKFEPRCHMLRLVLITIAHGYEGRAEKGAELEKFFDLD